MGDYVNMFACAFCDTMNNFGGALCDASPYHLYIINGDLCDLEVLVVLVEVHLCTHLRAYCTVTTVTFCKELRMFFFGGVLCDTPP